MLVAVSCSGMLSLHLNIWMACTGMTIRSACNNWTWSTNSQFHISQLSDVLGLVVVVVWVHPVLGVHCWVGSCTFLNLDDWRKMKTFLTWWSPNDCSPTIESMRSISGGIYDPHSLKSLASPHYLMAWYQGSNDQAWPNILLLGRISFLANDCSVDNGCQKIHNINAHSDLQGWKPKKNSPGLRLVPFLGKLPHESPQKVWKSGNEPFLS